MIWWHDRVLRHVITVYRVSAPAWDFGARGYLYKCSCGKKWAK